jgi:hypothetical protein
MQPTLHSDRDKLIEFINIVWTELLYWNVDFHLLAYKLLMRNNVLGICFPVSLVKVVIVLVKCMRWDCTQCLQWVSNHPPIMNLSSLTHITHKQDAVVVDARSHTLTGTQWYSCFRSWLKVTIIQGDTCQQNQLFHQVSSLSHLVKCLPLTLTWCIFLLFVPLFPLKTDSAVNKWIKQRMTSRLTFSHEHFASPTVLFSQ